MKKYSIFAAALSLAAIVSCQKEISENQQTTITPEIELESITLCTGDSQSKTSVSGNNIFWTADDKIDIFSNADGYSKAYPLSVSEVNINNRNAAKFIGEVVKGTTNFYAVYPSGFATVASTDLINITVPTNQTPKENSFGEEMNISVAEGTKTPGNPQVDGVTFHNVCSYLKFTVPSYITNVNRVDVTCDNRNIAGSTTVNYANLKRGSGTVTGYGTSNTVSMSVKSGSFAPGGTFWFVLTPGEVKKLTIKLYTEDGKNWTRTSSKPFTLNIGQPKNLGTIDFALTDARAIHTTDTDGKTLTGTEVKVSLGIISSLMSSVTAVNLQVANSSGKVVRTYNYSGKLTDNFVTIPADSDWPYLPQGNYTISGTYTIDKTIKNFAQTSFISPKPEFIVNTPSAHTSYDTYKKSGANAANAEDGSTIYISNKGVTISDKILNNDNYASGYSYTIDGSEYETLDANGNPTNLSWDRHDVVAKFTFDGVTVTFPACTCHVTGLPYHAPSNSTFKKNWSVTQGKNTSVNDQNMVLRSGIGSREVPTVNCNPFHIPSKIYCNINGNYTLVSKQVGIWYTTTFKLLLNGTEVVTKEGGRTNSKQYPLYKDIELSSSANFSATSSYVLGENVYATIESFNIVYKGTSIN